jgi:hypothetical protein
MEKRIHPFTNQPQYLIPSLMAHLKKIQRKRHNRQVLFTIVVTMVDIYLSPEWNFVYGEASSDEGIDIYSFFTRNITTTMYQRRTSLDP